MITCNNPACENHARNLKFIPYDQMNPCCVATVQQAEREKRNQPKPETRRDCPHQAGYCTCEMLD